MIVGVHGPWYQTTDTDWYSRDLPLLRDAGIKHLRLGTGITSQYVNRALSDDIEVIANLGTTGLPDLNAFRQYVINQVGKYAGRVRGWVVLNEVNIWSGVWATPPVEYVAILKTAYEAIKTADPNALVLTSNFMYADRGKQYLDELFAIEPNLDNYFDVVAVDPYCYGAAPTDPSGDQFGHSYMELPAFIASANMHAPGKPVWIIEMGWPVKPCSTYDSRAIDEATQALYIGQALEMAESWGVERFYMYKWMDSTGEHCMGVIPSQYNPPYIVRPVYDVIKAYIVGAVTYVLRTTSEPIDVEFTVDGVIYPPNSEITVAEGETIIVSVPERVVEA